MQTELVLGYDPGGNGAHGLALASMLGGVIERVSTRTFATTQGVIECVESLPAVRAIGVDTLTCWSTGSGGWRPADRWLRNRYPEVRNSVMTPNGLAGSMCLNGMSVLIAVRRRFPDAAIVETHPKVLYWALSGRKHSYSSINVEMDRLLCAAYPATFSTNNEHEWDAALSALAAVRGILGHWRTDLHSLATSSGEALVTPCGPTNYFWPDV